MFCVSAVALNLCYLCKYNSAILHGSFSQCSYHTQSFCSSLCHIHLMMDPCNWVFDSVGKSTLSLGLKSTLCDNWQHLPPVREENCVENLCECVISLQSHSVSSVNQIGLFTILGGKPLRFQRNNFQKYDYQHHWCSFCRCITADVFRRMKIDDYKTIC